MKKIITATIITGLIFPINVAQALDELIPPQALELIKEFEGFSQRVYRDPGDGSPTIGYGMDEIFGRRVRWTDRITREQADLELVNQLQKNYLPKLKKIPTWEKLSCNQQAALIDFSWNTGPNWYGHPRFKTISQIVRDSQWEKINVLRLYINPHTSVTRGLLRRRNAEIDLFKNSQCE